MLAIIEKVCLWSAMLLVAALVSVVFLGGIDRLSLTYIFAAPADLGRVGGIGPLILNTFVMIGAAVLTAFPVALFAALEYSASIDNCSIGNQSCRILFRRVLEVGLALPRLLWGLAGSVVFCGLFGFGLSAAAGILTMACLILPILISGFLNGFEEAGIRLKPTCTALGLTKKSIWFKLILPEAMPTVIASLMLAIGRALGDAAALLLTAGLSSKLLNGIDHSASTLAVFIYTLAIDVGGGQSSAFAASSVLLILVFLIQLPLAIISEKSAQSNN